MTARVGINGFGRIGRNFLRCALERDIKVVGINDIAPTETLAHLLAYDSTYGPLAPNVRTDGDAILVDHDPIPVTSHREPDELDWGGLGADIVIEASGRFRSRDEAARHLKVGASKVLISAPGKHVDLTVVMGVNPPGDRARASRSCLPGRWRRASSSRRGRLSGRPHGDPRPECHRRGGQRGIRRGGRRWARRDHALHNPADRVA